jgi:hypothetical protein
MRASNAMHSDSGRRETCHLIEVSIKATTKPAKLGIFYYFADKREFIFCLTPDLGHLIE